MELVAISRLYCQPITVYDEQEREGVVLEKVFEVERAKKTAKPVSPLFVGWGKVDNMLLLLILC